MGGFSRTSTLLHPGRSVPKLWFTISSPITALPPFSQLVSANPTTPPAGPDTAPKDLSATEILSSSSSSTPHGDSQMLLRPENPATSVKPPSLRMNSTVVVRSASAAVVFSLSAVSRRLGSKPSKKPSMYFCRTGVRYASFEG